MGKNTGLLVLFALSAVLCGCGEKTLSYRMADFSRKEPGCDTLSGEMCATVNLRYPVFSGGNEAAAEAANETIAGIVFGEMRTADSLCGVFFGQWEKFNSENKPDTHPAEDEKESDHQEDAGYVSPWYYAASIDVKGEYRGCLSLAHTVSTNAFFARKPFIRKYFVLNGKSGILLSPADLFSDTLAVRKVVTAVFREKLRLSRLGN